MPFSCPLFRPVLWGALGTINVSSRLPPSSSVDRHWNYSDSKCVSYQHEQPLTAVSGLLPVTYNAEQPSPDVLTLCPLPSCVCLQRQGALTDTTPLSLSREKAKAKGLRADYNSSITLEVISIDVSSPPQQRSEIGQSCSGWGGLCKEVRTLPFCYF